MRVLLISVGEGVAVITGLGVGDGLWVLSGVGGALGEGLGGASVVGVFVSYPSGVACTVAEGATDTAAVAAAKGLPGVAPDAGVCVTDSVTDGASFAGVAAVPTGDAVGLAAVLAEGAAVG